MIIFLITLFLNGNSRPIKLLPYFEYVFQFFIYIAVKLRQVLFHFCYFVLTFDTFTVCAASGYML